MNESAVI